VTHEKGESHPVHDEMNDITTSIYPLIQFYFELIFFFLGFLDANTELYSISRVLFNSCTFGSGIWVFVLFLVNLRTVQIPLN